MLGLPKVTELSKQLPKKAVYAKFQMNTAAKEKIDADISKITIVNEITPGKINIPAGDEVGSFFVLLVALLQIMHLILFLNLSFLPFLFPPYIIYLICLALFKSSSFCINSFANLKSFH